MLITPGALILLLAQALPLRARVRLPSGGERIAVGNAVRVAGGYALTAAHCLRWATRDSISVGGRPAYPVARDGELALLSLHVDVAAGEARIADHTPEIGERAVHRWWAYTPLPEEVTRQVTWRDFSYIGESFPPGSSGSGIYTREGDLVGIVESPDGFVWDVLSIYAFLHVHHPAHPVIPSTIIDPER